MKYNNPLAQKAVFHEVVTWESFSEKDCLGCHLLPLPICLSHANASEDDKVAQKEWKTKREREKTLEYAFKIILSLGKRREALSQSLEITQNLHLMHVEQQ